MRDRRYTYATTISFGGDTPIAEFEVAFSYAVNWGRPATPPCYSHGGLPADPDEIDDICVTSVDGRTSGWSEYESDAAFAETLISRLSEHDFELMLEEAAEADQAEADDYAEMRADERRLEER